MTLKRVDINPLCKCRFLQANVEDLPFEDKVLDVVLSIFGYMFAPPNPEIANKEIICVTKAARLYCIFNVSFCNGKLFKAMAKHMPANTTTLSIRNQLEQQQPSTMGKSRYKNFSKVVIEL